jgi:hypothetical protein
MLQHDNNPMRNQISFGNVVKHRKTAASLKKFHGFSPVELRANQNYDIVRSFSKYSSLGKKKTRK